MSESRVLVTGATGFLGGHLARALRPDGAQGAARTIPAHDAFQDAPIDWVKLPAPGDHVSLVRVLSGVDVVVHAAGRAHVTRELERDPLAAFRAANVDTTRALATAAVEAGVRRFILLSSLSVYGETATGLVDAATPVSPSTPYGISRKDAEDVLRSITVGSQVKAMTLRLPMVYGPGMKGNPLRLFHLVNRVPALPLGGIRNLRSMLYVKNLVATIRKLLDESVTDSGSLLVADTEPVSTPDLVREIADALGRRPVMMPVPAALMRALASLGRTVIGDRFPLSPETWDRLSGSLVIDTKPLSRVLGAVPPVSRREALRATAEWYRAAYT